MKKNIYFTPFGKFSVTATTIFILLIAIGGWYSMAIHKEADAIRVDGGYYAIGSGTNQFGLPEVAKKQLK